MSAKAESAPRSMIVAVLVLTLLVMGLGAAVLVVKLRPDTAAPSTSEQTLNRWEEAVAKDPESDVAQTGLGMALLELGRVSDARSAFQEAVRLNAHNWMANFQLGLLARASDPDRALDFFNAAVKDTSADNKAVVYIAKGDFLLAQGDAEGAKDAYRLSIANAYYLFDSHLGLAQAYEELGNTKAALKEYREAGRFAPGNEDVAAAIARLKGTN